MSRPQTYTYDRILKLGRLTAFSRHHCIVETGPPRRPGKRPESCERSSRALEAFRERNGCWEHIGRSRPLPFRASEAQADAESAEWVEELDPPAPRPAGMETHRCERERPAEELPHL